MKRLPWTLLVLSASAIIATFAAGGCGSEEAAVDDTTDAASEGSLTDARGDGFINAITDGGRADAANCKLEAQTCAKSSECCTANCDVTTKKCSKPIGLCTAPGQACKLGPDCCTFSCIGGTCSMKQCVADNLACGADNECCGGKCAPDGTGGGKCTPLNGSGPATSGNPCTMNSDCASKLCNNGLCTNPSFCVQENDVCTANNDCCGGSCVIATGATIGKCGAPVSAPGVPQCAPEGTVCGVGTSTTPPTCGQPCCSRSCGPYSATNILVCQAASGCHPTGEICRADSDCCGWSGSPDPKKGFVTCAKSSSTQEFGRCDNGGSCREPGSICKPTTASCSAENNCCDPVGKPSNYCNNNPDNCCHQDALGIPRCLIKPVDCVGAPPPAGTVCATSADCCNAPCVNNVCGGQGTCVPAAGGCTTNADCCAGLPCAVPTGGTKGVCGGSILPDGGVTTDGGGPVTNPDGGTCALYGQQCTQSGDCCSGVPCTNLTCRFP